MFCTRCGAELPDGARFCTCCGAKVEQLGFELEPEASASPTADVCPVCGTSVEAYQAFCTSCGAPLGAVASEPAAGLLDEPESFGSERAAMFTQPVIPAWAEAEVTAAGESMLEADSAPKAPFAEPETASAPGADAEAGPGPAASDASAPMPEPECEPVLASAPEAEFASIPGQEPDFDGEPERSPEAEADHPIPMPQPVTEPEQEGPSGASDAFDPACSDNLAPSAPEPERAVESAPFAPEAPAPEVNPTPEDSSPTTAVSAAQVAPDAAASATNAHVESPLPVSRRARPSAPASHAAVRRSAPEREPRRRSVGRIVASIVAVVAVLIIAAAIGSTGGVTRIAPLFGGKTVTASYLDDTPIAVDSATRIVPLRGEDDPLESYTVRPKQADSVAGSSLDIADVPRLEVTGSDGFAIGDFGTLAAGTYLFTVVDEDGVERDLPPVVIGGTDEADAAGRITVEPASGVTDPDALSVSGKYRCFRDKLQGLIDSFGDASLTVLKVDDDRYLAWTAGVSYAELVDFGDGVERLVVAYCTDRGLASTEAAGASAGDGDVGPTAKSYRVEVWEYDEEADAVSLVCQTRPAATDDDLPFIEYVSDPETGATCLYVGGTDVNGSRARSCFGVSDSGNFAELPAQGSDTWPRVSRYLMESSGLTQEAAVDAAPSGEFSCAETAQTVKDITARLNTILS